MTWWRVLTHGLWISGLSLILAAASYHLWLAHESGASRRHILTTRAWRWAWAVGVFLVSLGWALSMADTLWEKVLWFGLTVACGYQLLRVPAPRAQQTIPEVCLVAAVPLTLTAFMAPHVRALSEHYGVTLVSSGPPEAVAPLLDGRAAYEQVPIQRDIAPFRDLRALWLLWRLFRRKQFTAVHSITPKAGLLAMIAGRLSGVPVRVHWFTGQIWATRTGAARWLLQSLDRLLVRCATDLLADSPSQRQFLVSQGIVREGQVTVLEQGSVSGVDRQRFHPDAAARAATRAELSIPDAAVVLLFVGRVTRDKGVLDLAVAFAEAARACPTLYLIVVGSDEQGLIGRVRTIVGEVGDRFRFVDFSPEPERFMAAADVFVLPSYREGFGSSVIEAAACEVPAIGTRVYGLTDAIQEGVSGVLVPVADPPALTQAIVSLARDAEARTTMGQRARRRVEACFDQERLAAALVQFYRTLTRRAGSAA